MQIALKVDVDTKRGYEEGVPSMLKLFKRKGIRASFFFSFGPDNSGKALRRIFRKGFISKMLRTNAPGTYGIKTMLYGTILPAPLIVTSNSDVFQETIKEGHETGVHAWDHVEWQDCLPKMSRDRIKSHLDLASKVYEKYSGHCPMSCAAPAWMTTEASLDLQDQRDFLYCSDSRGKTPFIPSVGGRVFKTPQIPSTLPTMDEILGLGKITPQNVDRVYMKLLNQGLNVHTIHAEMEGLSMIGALERFIDRSIAIGASFTTLEEVAKKLSYYSLPICDIKMGSIMGRAGVVSLQGRLRKAGMVN